MGTGGDSPHTPTDFLKYTIIFTQNFCQKERFFFQKATFYPAILAKSVKYWTTF